MVLFSVSSIPGVIEDGHHSSVAEETGRARGLRCHRAVGVSEHLPGTGPLPLPLELETLRWSFWTKEIKEMSKHHQTSSYVHQVTSTFELQQTSNCCGLKRQDPCIRHRQAKLRELSEVLQQGAPERQANGNSLHHMGIYIYIWVGL